MEHSHKGASAWDVLWVLSIILWIGWIASDFLPADAQSVQAVVALSEKSPAAKAELASFLKATPNPDRSDLAKITKQINEILVTETARQVTGDKTLKTPTELAAQKEVTQAAELARLDEQAWRTMTNEERIQYLAGKWQIVALVMAIVLGGLIGTRVINASHPASDA